MESGIRGTTPALALTLPGDYLPWGRGDERVQVCGGLAPAQSCTPLFPYKCGSRRRGPMERGGGRESVAVDAVAATDTVSQRRVAIEVAGLAVWGGAQRRTKLTDEQVPLPLSALASALPLEQGTIGSDHRHRPKRIRPLCPPVDGVDKVDSGGQRWTGFARLPDNS
ncbi:MAG: hypothetical protein J6N54_07625 [Bacteroidales bacterium]|nr:hypothetical protein [Bacteroidales bacterium]